MNALLARLYGGPLRIDEAGALTWEIATAPYVIDAASPLQQEMWRRGNDRDTVRALRALEMLGAVHLTGGDPDAVAELTALAVRGSRTRLDARERRRRATSRTGKPARRSSSSADRRRGHSAVCEHHEK